MPAYLYPWDDGTVSLVIAPNRARADKIIDWEVTDIERREVIEIKEFLVTFEPIEKEEDGDTWLSWGVEALSDEEHLTLESHVGPIADNLRKYRS